MIGTWRGNGHGEYPGTERFDFQQEVTFSHDGRPFLTYFSRSWIINEKNEITETATANLVFLIADEWVTPPISAGILPGVVRAIAIEECGVRVRRIHISQIPEVKSGFLLSSLRIAQPISHIGEMKLEIGEASRLLEDEIRAHSQPVSVG